MDGIFLLVKLTTHDLWNPHMPEVSHTIELTGNSKTVLAIAWGGLWGGVARHRQVRTSAFAYPKHVYDLRS